MELTLELFHSCRLDDVLIVHSDVYHGVGQRGHVGRVEGVEAAGAALDSPVASHQLVVEVDADLGDGVVTREDQGADDVVPAVTPGLKAGNLKSKIDDSWYLGVAIATRDLRSSDHDGLAEVLQHEGEGRGRVAEGVSAVQHHKPVIPGVHRAKVSGYAGPVLTRGDVDQFIWSLGNV